MAWDKTKPANDELLVNFPAQCRANWEALEALTTSALQITTAKVSATAGIVDTQLAQITTAAKVSGAAITLLTSLPSGAGVIPDANSPHKLKADSGDTTPQYLDSLINTTHFEITAGDLLQLKNAGIDLTSKVTGILPTGNGGTGSASKNFIDLTTAQTVAGVKTFSFSPLVPETPTTDTQTASKGYVDTQIASGGPIADYSVGTKIEWEIANIRKSQADAYSVVPGFEFTCPRSGTVTVKIRAMANTTNSGTVRTYVNAVATGTEMTVDTEEERSDNVAVSAGDVIGLWGHRNGGGSNWFKATHMTILCDNPTYHDLAEHPYQWHDDGTNFRIYTRGGIVVRHNKSIGAGISSTETLNNASGDYEDSN